MNFQNNKLLFIRQRLIKVNGMKNNSENILMSLLGFQITDSYEKHMEDFPHQPPRAFQLESQMQQIEEGAHIPEGALQRALTGITERAVWSSFASRRRGGSGAGRQSFIIFVRLMRVDISSSCFVCFVLSRPNFKYSGGSGSRR